LVIVQVGDVSTHVLVPFDETEYAIHCGETVNGPDTLLTIIELLENDVTDGIR
jgi:hypothetical protein